MDLIYHIQFFEYWHSSSGLSAGTQSNLSVRKTKAGLPVLPGRVIKGLLNEAAYKIHSLHPSTVRKDFLKTVFGLGDDEDNEGEANTVDSDKSHQGQCFFSNAELSKGLTKALSQTERKKQISHLYQTLSFTAIAENGMADEKTLRTIEATVPLSLYGKIMDFPETEGYQTQMEYCMKAIQRIGLNRTRGMGRCQISIVSPKNDNQ